MSLSPHADRSMSNRVSQPFWFALVGSACVKQAIGAHPAMST